MWKESDLRGHKHVKDREMICKFGDKASTYMCSGRKKYSGCKKYSAYLPRQIMDIWKTFLTILFANINYGPLPI